MIDREAIRQILAQYAKHGWKLRRVLLSEPRDDAAGLFEGAEIRPAALDALWFSRSSRPGITAWELRHLSTAPYARVTNIPDGAPAAEQEEALKQVETMMIDATARRITGH